MVQITATQKATFQEIEDQRIIAEIAAYLDRLSPDGGPPYTAQETQITARDAYYRGRAFGLRWKDKLCLFAFLVRGTGGAALTEPLVENAMTEPGADPHHVLTQMLEGMKIADQAEL